MAEPRLTREAIQIAKAIAAARSHQRFRPTVTVEELDGTLAELQDAIDEIDTWSEIFQFGGEKILKAVVSLGVSYLKGGGFEALANVALQGIEPLMSYLRQKASERYGGS